MTHVPARAAGVTHRVLLIGDSHGSRPMIREGLRVAQQLQADVVVSVGDFGIWPGPDGKQFLDVCDRMAQSRGVPIIICPGNHDDYTKLDTAPARPDGLLHLSDSIAATPRPHTLVWGRWTWRFMGGAASIDGPGGIWHQNRGPLDNDQVIADGYGKIVSRSAGYDLGGWWPQERITDADVQATIAAGPADVLITHDAPTDITLTDKHKTTDPLEWPVGWRQREMVSQARDAVRPALAVAGHWHQHGVSHDRIGIQAVLSADVNPDEIQWAVIDDDTAADRPLLRLPNRWNPTVALTAIGSRQQANPQHQTIADLNGSDLAVVEWQDPAAYQWPTE